MILAIPRNKRPKATKPTSIPVAINGNAITTTPNAITNAPRPILLIRDDLGMCDDSPIATLSIPTTSNVIESRKIKVATPNAGFNMIASDKAIAITPRTICRIRMPLGDFSSFVNYINSIFRKFQCLMSKSYI